jgi:hypothetical protein
MSKVYATNANNSNGITQNVCNEIMNFQRKNPSAFIWSMNYGDEDGVKSVNSLRINKCDSNGITWVAVENDEAVGPFTLNQTTPYNSIINISTKNTKGGKRKSKKQTKSKKSNKSKKNKNQRK